MVLDKNEQQNIEDIQHYAHTLTNLYLLDMNKQINMDDNNVRDLIKNLNFVLYVMDKLKKRNDTLETFQEETWFTLNSMGIHAGGELRRVSAIFKKYLGTVEKEKEEKHNLQKQVDGLKHRLDILLDVSNKPINELFDKVDQLQQLAQEIKSYVE